MREMKETGYAAYSSRLIAANFLVRLLGIDWKMVHASNTWK